MFYPIHLKANYNYVYRQFARTIFFKCQKNYVECVILVSWKSVEHSKFTTNKIIIFIYRMKQIFMSSFGLRRRTLSPVLKIR